MNIINNKKELKNFFVKKKIKENEFNSFSFKY